MKKNVIAMKTKQDDLTEKLLGKTEKEVIEKLGKPNKKAKNNLIYYEDLDIGCHSHMTVITITLKDSKVKGVEVIQKAIGCVIIE